MGPSRFMADVSSNNSSVNLATYASAGHVAIAIKATEGAGYVNPLHRRWSDEAHAHGLTVCHYHFARPGHGDQGAERALFHRTYLAAWRKGDYLVLDLEVTEGADVAAYAASWLRGMEGFKHPQVLYTYQAFRAEHLGRTRADRWWIADYAPPLSSSGQWAKQYTDGETGPAPHHYAGIGDCDGSVLNAKTAAALWLRKKRTGRRS
jgi:GH25 family lysozyme M1 (1,4-beta-N-acetylmuramidase)